MPRSGPVILLQKIITHDMRILLVFYADVKCADTSNMMCGKRKAGDVEVECVCNLGGYKEGEWPLGMLYLLISSSSFYAYLNRYDVD